MAAQGGMTRPDDIIHIRTSADLTYKRAQLVTHIFGGSLPGEVENLFIDVASPVTITGATCQKLQLQDWTSAPRVWTPNSHNGDLMILHQGHTGGYGSYSMTAAIQAYIDAGFKVCGLVMPGGADDVTSGTSGNHNTNTPALSTFIGPIIDSINSLFGEGHIYMSGLSGGAWSTVLAAAVDTRIERAYPDTGSLPLHLPSSRDYEQYLPGLAVSYLDLYILGACGSGRRLKQISHIADDCCFRQADYNQSHPYAERVAEIATSLGGDYDLVWRTKATHEFDTTIISEEILAEL